MSLHKLTYLLVASLLLALCVSCSSHDDLSDEKNEVNLALRILPVSSRAGGVDLLKSDYMRNLRVVILSADRSRVIVNEVYPLGGDATIAETPLYRVETGDRLIVYLFANCEDLNLSGGKTLTDNKLFTDGSIDSATFTAYVGEADQYVPMTGKYDITIPQRDNIAENGIYQYPEALQVVRTCNKLSVEFANKSTLPITVKSYTISKVNTAGTTYLMPNVKQNKWFDILTGSAGVDDLVAEWIYNYFMPTGASNGDCTFMVNQPYGAGDMVSGVELACNSGFTDISRLIPETKYVEDGLLLNYLQTYQFSVETDRGTYTTLSLKDPYLPNLFSLFRNTSVYINVSFSQSGFEVDVQPYKEYAVGVDFGLKRNNLGDLIVELDNDGKYSYSFQLYLDSYLSKNQVNLYPVKGKDGVEIQLDADDYLAIHVGSDGDIYSSATQLWVMDVDGCRVLSNYAARDGSSDDCNSRLVEYFPTTNPDNSTLYRKDAEHDLRLQHHSDHSCVVMRVDGKMYYKYIDQSSSYAYLPVESWEGIWNPNEETTTPGVFYVEITYNGELCYRKYSAEGLPQNELIYPDGRIGYIQSDGSVAFDAAE